MHICANDVFVFNNPNNPNNKFDYVSNMVISMKPGFPKAINGPTYGDT